MDELNLQLFKAIEDDDIEELKRLMQNGADANAKNSYGMTLLHDSIRLQRNEIAKELIRVGANVNAKNSYGSVPLLDAIWRGNFEIIDELIRNGADANIPNDYGVIPLDELAKLNRP